MCMENGGYVRLFRVSSTWVTEIYSFFFFLQTKILLLSARGNSKAETIEKSSLGAECCSFIHAATDHIPLKILMKSLTHLHEGSTEPWESGGTRSVTSGGAKPNPPVMCPPLHNPPFLYRFSYVNKKNNLFTYPTKGSAGVSSLNGVLAGALSTRTLAGWLTRVSWACVHVVKIMNAGGWAARRINLGLLMISQTTRASLSQVAVSSTPLAYWFIPTESILLPIHYPKCNANLPEKIYLGSFEFFFFFSSWINVF